MKKQGTARLAEVLDKHTRSRTRRAPATDLATIQADGSLLLDTFGVPIPAGDYLVDERFTQENPLFETSSESGGSGDASFAEHTHTIGRADTPFRPLTAGDRVLCVMLDADGDAPTPYVIGRL